MTDCRLWFVEKTALKRQNVHKIDETVCNSKKLKLLSEYSGAIMLGPGVRGGVDWMRKLALDTAESKEIWNVQRKCPR